MQHTARIPLERASRLLDGLGVAVRARRTVQKLTIKALAARAHVSERFLVQLEGGEGNISVLRLADVAEALDTDGAQLLLAAQAVKTQRAEAPVREERGVVALLGLRGAGKSTLGARIAKKLKLPFVELDQLIAREAGMNLSTIFEMHGEAYFRRIERDALRKFLEETPAAVLATGGSLVTDAGTFELLRRRTRTIWLKARPRDHWDRVVAQGDGRPMRDRANAMSELKALLETRKPLYAQAAHVVDTSSMSLDEATSRIVMTLSQTTKRKR